MSQLIDVLTPDALRILAADNTAMSTQLLAEALAKNEQFHVIEAQSEAEILPLVKRETPHVALIGARCGEGDPACFDMVRNIRAEHSGPRVVVLLDRSEPVSVVEAFRAGAHGIFCRTQPLRMLTRCIECVHSGQIWATSGELHFVLEALAKPPLGDFLPLGNPPLSARESDVVRCVAEGLSNRDIARRLRLTEHTVKNYLFRIFDKLGVSSRVEVVLLALGSTDARAHPAGNHRRSQPPDAPHQPPAPIPITLRKREI